MQLLFANHQFPNFLQMELEFLSIPKSVNQWELYLNVNFGQNTIQLLNGEIKFALRSAKLLLELKNCQIIINNLDNDLICFIDNDFSLQPQWEIRHQPDTKFLQGQITKINLGVIESSIKSAVVIAKIVTNPADIILTEISGLWRHDLSPNKHGILERKLAQFVQQTQFNPYLSQVIAVEDKNNHSFPSTTDNQKNINEEEYLSELKNLIQLIYQTPTDNFMELAKIAGLNPLKDLAGGDLTGTNLSSMNLSGANLRAVNLRGADLTDTDLSEANLQYARLNGADLTGTYLEGANLSYANLQSASLALANLIGANLKGANLTTTNLQNTTLAKTQLQGAIFHENIGITPERQQELQEQGAIIN